MDWKLFAITFGTVFVAELGDKTQLAALAFTADSKKPWTIFAAASLALVVVTAIGVASGSLLSRWINPAWVRRRLGDPVHPDRGLAASYRVPEEPLNEPCHVLLRRS